nr:Gag-Pol polyprotein [Tanacetum cinerariifolium]
MIRRTVSKTRKKKEENETFNHDLAGAVRRCKSEVHTEDPLPLPRYGLDAPPARAGLSNGYDRTIDYGENLCSSHSSAFRLSYGSSIFFKEANQASKFVLRLGITPIGLAASGNLLSCLKSKKQVTPNPPEGGSKATSEGDWIKVQKKGKGKDVLDNRVSDLPGKDPSNSEVGSQYTDTPMIDMDLSLVTGEHSEGKPALAFSTPTGISLGGSS